MEYSEEEVIQNMKDAGCDDACIQEFLEEYRQGDQKKCDMVLSRYRRELLDQLHREQKKIDCLDYLCYQMKQNRKEMDEKNQESVFREHGCDDARGVRVRAGDYGNRSCRQ